MPSLMPTNVAASMQEQLAVFHARWNDLTNKTLENMMELIDMGLKAARESMAESTALTQQFFYANSPQELLSLSAEVGRSNVERAVAFGGDVANIAAAIQGDLSNAAQTEFANACQKASMLVDNLSQGLPDDSNSPYSIMKFAIEKASNGYEQWAVMTKQVTQAADSNLSMATGQFPSSKKAAGRAKKGGERE